jgi:PAS domain S-box-containing protein
MSKSTPRQIPGSKVPEKEIEETSLTVPQVFYVLLGIIVLSIGGMIAFNYDTLLQLSAQYTQLLDASQGIKHETIESHLLLDQAADSPFTANIPAVWEHLARADRHSSTLAEVLSSKGSVLRTDDLEIHETFRKLRGELALYEQFSRELLNEAVAPSGNPDSARVYQSALESVINSSDKLEAAVNRSITDDLRRSQINQIFLASVCVALSLSIVVVFFRLERRRKEIIKQIQNANLALREEIDARCHTEMALRDRECSLRQTQKMAHVGSWELDTASGLIRLSGEICRIYGIPEGSQFESLEKSFEIIHPDDRDKVAATAHGYIDTGALPHAVTFRIVRPDGDVRWIIATQPEARRSGADDDAKIMIGTVQDITEIKLAEQELRASEKRYRTLVETMSEGLAVTDENDRLTFVNQALCRMYETSTDTFVGFPVTDFLDEMNQGIYLQRLQSAREGLVNPYELTAVANGREKPLMISPTAFFDTEGKFKGGMAVVTDLADRKRIENRLRETSSIINRSPAVAFLWKNQNGRPVEFVTENVRQLTGYAADDFLSGKLLYTEIIHPEDRDRVDREIAGYADGPTNTGFVLHPHRIVTGTDDIKWLETVTEIRRDDQGVITHFQGLVIDVTERKLAEDQLQQRTQELDARIRELRCLYGATQLMDSPERSPQEVFCALVELIPPAMQAPSQTCALIAVEGRKYAGPTFVQTAWREQAEISVEGATAGHIEVCLLENPPNNGRAAFLPEELKLLHALAGLIGRYIERQRTEKRLERIREEYAAVANMTSDIIVKFDAEYDWTFVNDGACAFWGKPREQLLQQNFLQYMHPDDIRETTATILEIIAGKKSIHRTVNRQKTPQGWREIEWSGVPLYDLHGRYIGMQATGRDVTEQRQAERTLFEYQQQLRRLAAELSATEEQERRQLATKLHDGTAQLLAFSRMRLITLLRQGQLAPETAQTLTTVKQQIETALEQTKSLTLELSPPVLYELEFNDAIEWLAEWAQSEHGISTEFAYDGPPVAPAGDIRAVLFQATRELLINIVKHAEATWARITLRRNNNMVEIEVADNGKGFNPATVGIRRDGGGFGLFNIRERLNLCGGCLRIDSGPGRASRVTVVAPIDKDKRTEREVHHEYQNSTGG